MVLPLGCYTTSLVWSACVSSLLCVVVLHYFLLVSACDMKEKKLQCVGETVLFLLLHALHVVEAARQLF